MSEALIDMNATAVADENQNADAVQEAASQEGGEEKLLAGKYKTAEELEKGYKELSKKLREGKVEAPEEYSLEAVSEFFDAEDPMLGEYLGVFKELGLSQAQADALLAKYGADMAAQNVDPEAEKAKLGAEGEAMIKGLESFFAKQKGNFSEAEQAALGSMASTADGVKALNKLVSLTREQNIPEQVASTPGESKAELLEKANKLRADPAFYTKPSVQEEYNKLMSLAVL